MDARTDAQPPDATVFAVVVGENGAIAHCTRHACDDVPSPTDRELDGVHVVARDQAYAVGAQGAVLHWDGITWEAQTSPTTLNLSRVDGVGTDLAFAVGEDGIILRYDGTGWQEVASPVRGRGEHFYLIDVDLLTPSFGLAVGGSAMGDDGVILRYDGNDWTLEREGQDPFLTAVGTASASCAAAGGYSPYGVNASANLLAWDGNGWTPVDGLEYRRFVSGIDFANDQLGFAVTDGPSLFATFDGTDWAAGSQVHDADLTDVFLIDETLGFAIGGGIDHPDVLVWDGSLWSRIDTTALDTPYLRGVSGVRLQ